MVIMLWAVPGILLRMTPAVLVILWLAGEVVVKATGDYTPAWYYIRLDLAAMAVMLLWLRKPSPENYRDWAVFLLFPVAWCFYPGPYSEQKWYILWAIMMAQLIISGPWPFIYRLRTTEGRRGYV